MRENKYEYKKIYNMKWNNTVAKFFGAVNAPLPALNGNEGKSKPRAFAYLEKSRPKYWHAGASADRRFYFLFLLKIGRAWPDSLSGSGETRWQHRSAVMSGDYRQKVA